MKRLARICLVLGIILIPLTLIHWLFILAALFAIIAFFLLK